MSFIRDIFAPILAPPSDTLARTLVEHHEPCVEEVEILAILNATATAGREAGAPVRAVRAPW